MDCLNVLSLCAGGGGLDLGLKLAVPHARTVCWVEWEAFACSVLAGRMETAQLDASPLWSDLRTFDGRPWRGNVDCVVGGYPCQPFSLAGKRLGSDDPRHLWPHVRRVVGEVQPSVCFFENVSGHLSLGFGDVAADLEAMGYDVAAGLFTAEEVGASHRRERLFILANSRSVPASVPASGWEGRSGGNAAGAGGELADARQPGPQGWGEPYRERADQLPAGKGRSSAEQPFPPGPADLDAWRAVPDALAPAQSKVRLLADGLAADRARWLRLLGNGVVPLQAAYAFCSLWSALRFQHLTKEN